MSDDDKVERLLGVVLARISEGQRFAVNDCSMCGYRCAYVSYDTQRGVLYDNGCDCTSDRGGENWHTVDALRDLLRMNPMWHDRILAGSDFCGAPQ